jgi:outer membrane protein assembly factor BamB
MKHLLFGLSFVLCASFLACGVLPAEELSWNQWRGQTRDAVVPGPAWPQTLSDQALALQWRVELDESYSGPVVSDRAVFVTGTASNMSEVVVALDRSTGKQLWRSEWEGAMKVPFFAASNGSWIRSTPAYDGQSLFVAGMRDVLVSLNAETGKEQWRIDFVEQLKSPLPAFGCVCSPLLEGDALYIQAGASVVKVDKNAGKILWQSMRDDGGMSGSAFSSPIIATIAGERQLIVQTREKLAGVNLENGDVMWEHTVPSFRGMNILTPVVFEEGIFTSSYQHNSWLFRADKNDGKIQIAEAWTNNAQGYMSTPVVVGEFAYMHLQNQRFTCINLRTGERTWTSQPFGKYCSLVVQGDKILALDQRGTLLLLKANPVAFELLDQRKISEEETWAHLAIAGTQLFVRELKAISAWKWE